jgi:hypothetical protein
MSLRVERLRNTFVTPRDLPRREQACARIESSVAHSGAGELARRLDEVLDPADPSVWVIRRLRLSFAMSDPRQAGELWARGIAEGLRRQIQSGPDGFNVLRFADRAAYWTSMLRDLALGQGARWWNGPLDGLRMLDFGGVCVALLSREPELTARVLAQLDELGSWDDVARQIGEPNAEQLLRWIAESEEMPALDVLDEAIDVWVAAPDLGASGEARLRLWAAVRLLCRIPGAAPAAVRGAVEMLSEAERVFRSMGAGESLALVAAVWSGEPSMPRIMQSAPARVRMLLRVASRDKVEALVERLEDGSRQRSDCYRTYATEFGGWFLLLPSYISIEADALTEEVARPALRWLIARMCMGPRGRAADPDDPSLLWACGLEKAPPPGSLPFPGAALDAGTESNPDYFGAETVEQAWAPVAAAVLRRFASQLPGFASSSPRHLDANLFEGRASLHLAPGLAEVVVSPRPLDILLRMGGFDGKSYSIPWNGYAAVTIRLG